MHPSRSEIDFCLLIPCYNNFTGLISSLKSVVYPADKFLIVVVDDGSKEAVTEERIQKEIGNAKPVVVIQNEKNLGITATLNNGLRWIEENTNSKYIARLDCGDICAEERFVIQVQYMDGHPEVGLIGSWCIFEDKKTFEKYHYKTPLDHLDILKAMHFRNVFIHPTTIFRTMSLSKVGNYPISFEHAEDYAFFWKLINYQPSHIIDRFLVTCEVNLSGISYSNRIKQLKSRWKIVKTYGSYKIMKIIGFIRILLLYIIPKSLVLRLKKMIAD
ncbi:glycosyltransferase [Terrimonas pollutisoli]|uniref:glycosyltransferase n=1 Tax=Terrimonas pollutisoli TaxID=3034147 RepID=UPI0023EC4539|nr:glycosyltransferase [Terrimonas sp. H1YJ31]